MFRLKLILLVFLALELALDLEQLVDGSLSEKNVSDIYEWPDTDSFTVISNLGSCLLHLLGTDSMITAIKEKKD